MIRIQYKFLGVPSFAIRQNGESAIEAVERSIKRKAGVGRVLTRKVAALIDRSDRLIGHEFNVTVCGPKSKQGGWPVISEFKLTLPA
jgi:hypothetical protein